LKAFYLIGCFFGNGNHGLQWKYKSKT
jgi:hypothetical protein